MSEENNNPNNPNNPGWYEENGEFVLKTWGDTKGREGGFFPCKDFEPWEWLFVPREDCGSNIFGRFSDYIKTIDNRTK